MGWTFPWASSFGSDFNFDFNVSFTEEQQREGGIEYNYRRDDRGCRGAQRRERRTLKTDAEIAAMTGTDVATYTRERPGMSAFALEDGVVYHTYSAYARGWTASGACTSGSTARPRDATRPASGCAATTSTTKAERFAKSSVRSIGVSRRGFECASVTLRYMVGECRRQKTFVPGASQPLRDDGRNEPVVASAIRSRKPRRTVSKKGGSSQSHMDIASVPVKRLPRSHMIIRPAWRKPSRDGGKVGTISSPWISRYVRSPRPPAL